MLKNIIIVCRVDTLEYPNYKEFMPHAVTQALKNGIASNITCYEVLEDLSYNEICRRLDDYKPIPTIPWKEEEC